LLIFVCVLSGDPLLKDLLVISKMIISLGNKFRRVIASKVLLI